MAITNVREDWRPVTPFFAANVLFGSGLFAHAFLYNFYLDELGHGEAVMGAAAAALTAGGLAALVPAGLALDRWGARATYSGAVLLAAVGLLAGCLVTRQPTVYAAAFFAGAGAAGWRVSMAPIFMAVASDRVRSRAFSWNVGLLLASGALWTAMAGVVPGQVASVLGVSGLTGLRVSMGLGAGGTLLAAAAFLLVPLPPGRRAGPGEGGAARASAGQAGRTDRAAPVRVPGDVRRLVGLILVWMLAAALVLPFFNIYFQRVHQMPVARIGLLFGAVQGLTALAVFAGGEVAYRVGPGRALAGWVFVFPVALLALVAGPPLALAIAIYAVQGLVPPATNPLLDEIVLNRADPSVHGAASSWRNGATELSGLLGASLGGLILASTGFGTLFGIAAAVAAVGGGALARSVVARRA